MTSKKIPEGIFETSIYNFQQTAKRLKLSDKLIARIMEPKEKIEITLNPEKPDGDYVHVKVFVVRHNDTLGPSKGGIRMASDVTLDDICGLSMEMTWKTALIGVPFGGGKSGIQFDPTTVSEAGKEVIIRAFTRAVLRHIGPEVYVPAPDMGTNEADMGHIRDCISYSSGKSITQGCFVTGKPVILGGIEGRREATGKGCVYTVQAACQKMGIDISQTRTAVQGFGNVGSVAALEIAKLGSKVIAVSDVTGGIVNEQGLDLVALVDHVNVSGGIKGFAGGTDVASDEVLYVDCDILIPAAAQSQITAQNADKVKAKIIAEGANAPMTPDGDEILYAKGAFIIPDILANAGGVFVSYLEYTQETQREQMTLEDVEQRLYNRMFKRFGEVYDYSQSKKVSMRDAAMDIGVQKVADGIIARGLLP
ncbi:MAG: Glu/Leu/Phe/Val dehydrogenase [Phycisphaerae bacterium]|nr:Glu/Leu/Phe/Val dehydrogenase [Phycisphaerae bacterium]